MRAVWAALALITLVGAILSAFRGDWIYAVSGVGLFFSCAIMARAATSQYKNQERNRGE